MLDNDGRGREYDIEFVLKTRAQCVSLRYEKGRRVEKKHTRTVTVGMKHGDPLGWVLDINDTPGSWYISSLTDDGIPEPLSIVGDYWFVTNTKALIKEALTVIAAL